MNRNLNILITVFLVAITACADSALEEWKPYLPSEGKFLTLSSESLSFVADGGSEVITVTTDGTFTVSTNESWLLVTSERNTITITALTNTTTNSRTGIVFVSLSNNTSSSLSKTVSVQQNARSNLINGHEYVDLGLPSGTLWASWNVGATAPEEYGDYYAWGETEEKDFYDIGTYEYSDGSYETCHFIGKDIAGTEYDVAHVKWGGSWRMPTRAQINELLDNCTWDWTTQNGVEGQLVTGPNGNVIFLPAAGGGDHDPKYQGENGYLWSSTFCPNDDADASYLCFYSYMWYWGYTRRSNGLSVRPVITPEKPQTSFSCPDGHHPHMIDLGLSSGTKWSCCNVDATNPVEKGNYYAWGETETKDRFRWSNYTHCDGTEETCHDIGGDISGTEYDVAYVKWGPDWQMPSYDQCKELLHSCSFEETSYNGVKGCRIVGPSGLSIFMPATDNWPFDGAYWSATLDYFIDHSYFMALWGSSGELEQHMVSYPRYEGCCVRPVAVPKKQYPVAEAIDLGLPSGTKWASWNVGASKPEEYGGYYAWGETEEKEYYDWSTYKYCNGSHETCQHIGDDIAGTQYDVAHMKWGDLWRMPSSDQILELIDYCTRKWTNLNGVNGTLVIGPNGATIFLPATGNRMYGLHIDKESTGFYWSSSSAPEESYCEYCLLFDSGHWNLYYSSRDLGKAVRPVISPEKPQGAFGCPDSNHPH